jgi:hypothetical protein
LGRNRQLRVLRKLADDRERRMEADLLDVAAGFRPDAAAQFEQHRAGAEQAIRIA